METSLTIDNENTLYYIVNLSNMIHDNYTDMLSDPLKFHKEFENNPVLQNEFVIHDVWEEFRYLYV